MQVILIGSGNIARLMGRLLLKKGHIIQQVWSRQEAHAASLAKELNAVPVTDLAHVAKTADIYIVAVTDDALPFLTAQLSVNDKLVIHTSGTAPLDILKHCSTAYGVLWPIKMVRSSADTLSPATLFIDGNTPAVIESIRGVAALFSENITTGDDDKRARMHLAATFTTNFSNHLFHLAADFCKKEGLSFSNLYPLIESAVLQIKDHDPADLQAGPAFRGDLLAIQKHLQLLENEPQMIKIYNVTTESIVQSRK